MIDWSQPHSLAKVTEDAGFTMSDVAFVSGLDESTISRLWDDPHWLDRVKGRSLQALVASVPGVAEYFASHSVLTRRNKLISQLEAEGLQINHQALHLSNAQRVPHQYLINALEAAVSIMQGDETRTCCSDRAVLGNPAEPSARSPVLTSSRNLACSATPENLSPPHLSSSRGSTRRHIPSTQSLQRQHSRIILAWQPARSRSIYGLGSQTGNRR